MKRFVSVLTVLALIFAGTACSPENGENGKKEETPAVSVTEITLDTPSMSIIVGDLAVLMATVAPNDATKKALSWSSSNESVAKVDAEGNVEALARGKADIVASATDGSGVTATCEVTVSNRCPEGAVDLGVTTPDGFVLYWGTSNLNATGMCEKPEDFGDFFAWGETEPYYISRDPFVWKDGKSEGYVWTSYKWFKDFDEKKNARVTKYCQKSLPEFWGGEGEPDGKIVLDPEDDAAHVLLGDNWRMPTSAEYSILYKASQKQWISVNGTYGIKVVGPNGNSIFLPASGLFVSTYYAHVKNQQGYYWAADLVEKYYSSSNCIGVSTNGMSPGGSSGRCSGQVIRPVSD